ncbi:hypothetical protein SAMN06265365_12386 [Tistlia consotensis]|uniref:Uncharacterized protein n=1 Tax=Tistlia consotensis USBA 355 TaxID=560819 RepID=A0A1Y6CH46_9PROT|nr:hypothetical protein SAMN05428998_12523 [Tistlia consotensis USBA 355]SNR98082.1 hypothetical protein SAMN06265365_12386 [Tistlia consotensis]
MGAVDHEAHLASVDEQYLAAPVAELVVLAVAGEEPEAGGDLRRVEQLPRQGDHAVDHAFLDQLLADFAFTRLVRRHRAVGQHEARDARGREVMHDVLHPGVVGVARWRVAIPPALVAAQPLAAPVGDVEGRVGEDEVGLQVGVAVVVEGVAMGDLPVDAPDGEVHLGQPPGGIVRLLAVDRDIGLGLPAIAVAVPVGVDELHRLHEHARGAAAGVVDPAAIGLQHLDQQLDDAAGRVELAALLALGAGELRQEVLVDASEHVLRPGFRVADLDVRDQVDELAEPGLVERGARIVFR